MMEVILLERVERLGQMGDKVKVKPGFARNFLLPRKKALRATKQNMSLFETQRAQLEAANLKRKGEAEAVAAQASDLSVVLIRQASENGQLFGSVRPRDVSEAVTAQGVTIDNTQVKLDIPIKTLGIHKLRVNLHPEVAITVSVNVARSEDEAKLQAAGKTPAMLAAAEAEADQAALADVFEDGAEPAETEDGADAADGEEAEETKAE
jgi:large subunit ribosomal protein L9